MFKQDRERNNTRRDMHGACTCKQAHLEFYAELAFSWWIIAQSTKALEGNVHTFSSWPSTRRGSPAVIDELPVNICKKMTFRTTGPGTVSQGQKDINVRFDILVRDLPGECLL